MNREVLAEQYGDHLLFLDPAEQFDQAIAGVVYRCAMDFVVAYDQARVINALIDSGMDPDEAVEYFDFNIAGSYIGKNTPVFLTSPEADA